MFEYIRAMRREPYIRGHPVYLLIQFVWIMVAVQQCPATPAMLEREVTIVYMATLFKCQLLARIVLL